uniref:Uncharacterized protein n=1 Tax=Rhizophora mucronata TaxID=61149 RepID=A0A2P2PMU8_RHIMU
MKLCLFRACKIPSTFSSMGSFLFFLHTQLRNYNSNSILDCLQFHFTKLSSACLLNN